MIAPKDSIFIHIPSIFPTRFNRREEFFRKAISRHIESKNLLFIKMFDRESFLWKLNLFYWCWGT